MYGSRFSSPYCPGVSVYSDDDEDGKICVGTMGKFRINAHGDCDDDKGCSLAVSGPVCPGVSRGVRDLKGGNRECKVDLENRVFQIGKDGKCIDKSNCALSLKSAVTAIGKGILQSAKGSCPNGYVQDTERFITKEEFDKGVRKACKGSAGSAFEYQFVNGAGTVVDEFNVNHSGKKSRSSKKMCYMRKSKGKSSRSRVCLDAAAVKRLVKGARKGGRNSHK
jgi:hypothetical protein